MKLLKETEEVEEILIKTRTQTEKSKMYPPHREETKERTRKPNKIKTKRGKEGRNQLEQMCFGRQNTKNYRGRDTECTGKESRSSENSTRNIHGQRKKETTIGWKTRRRGG